MAGSLPRSTAVRVGGAAVAMVIVAEAAVWLLAPRDEPPEPVPVAERDYFSAAELERAHDYRGPQRGAADRRARGRGRRCSPRRARAPGAGCAARLERLAARPLLGAAAAGAARRRC